MMQFDVVLWQDTLSDGAVCYAAMCPAVDYAHGQGDTVEETLAEVANTIAVFLEHRPGRFKTGPAAQDAVAEMIERMTAEGVECRTFQVVPRRNLAPAQRCPE